MGNNHVVPLHEINIFINAHVHEYDQEKVIIMRKDNPETYIVLYYHNDIKDNCYDMIKNIQNVDSVRIYHYKGKLMAMCVNDKRCFSENVLPGSGGYNLDLTANI